MRTWKRSAVLLVLAVLFLLTCWSTFVFSLVALLRAALASSSYEWFWGSLIVSGAFLLLAGLTGQAGYKKLKSSSAMPTRTLRVLKQDQAWVQNEVRRA
jgi:hypothetical protein